MYTLNYSPSTPVFLSPGNCGYVNHNNKLHHTFSKLAEHYGPIVGLQLGWYPAILLTDYKLIRKAFNGQPDIYSDRANHIFFRWLIGMDSGLLCSLCIILN